MTAATDQGVQPTVIDLTVLRPPLYPDSPSHPATPAAHVQLILEQPCGTCDASGQVPNGAWQEWNTRFDPVDEQLRRYRRRRDQDDTFTVPESEEFDRLIVQERQLLAEMDRLGPELWSCEDCDGSRLQLTDIGRTILAVVLRHHR